jgi:hypothetical protein
MAPFAARFARRAPTRPLGVAVGGIVLVANTAVIAAVLGIPGVVAGVLAGIEILITVVIVVKVRRATVPK